MATSIFSNLTSVDRRKNAVTYGKSSRLSMIAVPISSSSNDVPLLVQPRKHTSAANERLKRPVESSGVEEYSKGASKRVGSPDMFDIPSEDEPLFHVTKPSQRLRARTNANQAHPIVHVNRKPSHTLNGKSKKTESVFSKTEFQESEALAVKSSQKTVRLTQSGLQLSPSSDQIASSIQKRTVSQFKQKDKQDVVNQTSEKQPNMVIKANSRAIATAVAVPRPSRGMNKKEPCAHSFIDTVTQPAAEQSNMDVYDLSLSDAETPLPDEKMRLQVTQVKKKKPKKAAVSLAGANLKQSDASDGPATWKKRKRQEPISSSATTKSMNDQEKELLATRHSSKHQKREGDVPPGHKALDQIPCALKPSGPTVNKPRRTRTRIVPLIVKPTISKGQSAPAVLNSMVSEQNQSEQFSITESSEAAHAEDETMYEIPGSLATSDDAFKLTASNSVTPRQKTLFSSLLGESLASSRPMPRMSALRLTERKPNSLLGALAGSKSDLGSGAQKLKTRLIDTIKCAETSSEDDDDDFSKSQNDSESESLSSSKNAKQLAGRNQVSVDKQFTDTKNDHLVKDLSRSSQDTSRFRTRSKLTYAKSRSYLEEASLEDALLVSMDLDDALGLDSHEDDLIDDGEEPMSQVQARHELKKRGQQTAFQWEIETLINDMSCETSKSVRRSTMLELCNKMAEKTFTVELLESPLAQKFFRNLSSDGEIIFDFAASVAIVFVLQTDPVSTVLDLILQAGVEATLVKMAALDTDIAEIAKNRKTNLSRIAQQSVADFRATLRDSISWTLGEPEKLSPQVVALRALDLLSTCLDGTRSITSFIGQDEVSRLVDIASGPSERFQSGDDSPQDILVLTSLLSILESASVAKYKQPTWCLETLQRLANLLPIFFQPKTGSSTLLAVKICMNLTNNKSKACQAFSGPKFVQSLMSSIMHKFGQLDVELKPEQRTEMLETLILSLGAMINLAELNDVARTRVDDGKQMIATLIKIFVEGSERAAKAESMEESHSSVAIGYLTILLGNLCLNVDVRCKIREQLPRQDLGLLIHKMKEFLKFHERIESKSEGTWSSYTSRLELLVDRLEEVEG